MIISKLPPSTVKASSPIQFDERYVAPVRIASLVEDTATFVVFLSRESVERSNGTVSSITISCTERSAGESVGEPLRLGELGLVPRSLSNTIQSTSALAFGSAAAYAASDLIAVKLSMEVLQGRLEAVMARYVLPKPIRSQDGLSKQDFYDMVFVSGKDPGSFLDYETKADLIDTTYALTLTEGKIENYSTLPEWVFFKLTSYDSSGVYAGTASVRINTKTLIQEYRIVQQRSQPPPILTVSQPDSSGLINLVVLAEKPAKLYSVAIEPGSLLQDTGKVYSEFIGMSQTGGAIAGFRSKHLAESSANLSIYRAVDSLGRFTGQIVGGKLNSTCSQASLSMSRTNDGILVELLNVPANTSFVRIYRKSNTIDQVFDIGLAGTLILSKQTTGTPVDISVTDTLDQSISVVARPIYYTYYAECIDNNGNVLKTRESTLLIEPSSAALGFAKPTVSGLSTIFNPQTKKFEMTFQLGFDIAQDTVTTELVKVLAAQGLIQYYSDEIDPAKLTEMITAKATLRNMVTGEETFLGIHGINAIVAAGDLTPGYYKLELITTIRKAETAIDTYVLTGRSTPRPGTGAMMTYQYRPAVSANPSGLLGGNLVPSDSNQPNAAYQMFTGNSSLIGYFVDATYVPIDLFTSQKPSIVQKQTIASAVSPILEKITWLIDKSDSASSISHFMIYRSGVLRGVVAGNASNNTTYVFYDTPSALASPGQYRVVGYLFDGTIVAGSDVIDRS